MSDTGRESIVDKAAAAIKPDSEKSTTEHLGDSITGKADNVGSKAEPDSQKSMFQSVSDTITGK